MENENALNLSSIDLKSCTSYSVKQMMYGYLF